jgi:hypothetical protein
MGKYWDFEQKEILQHHEYNACSSCEQCVAHLKDIICAVNKHFPNLFVIRREFHYSRSEFLQ